MNIAISTNEKYSRYTYIMLTSLIANNPKERIDILVLISSEEMYGNMLRLKELETPDVHVEFVEVNKFYDFEKLPNNAQWSKEAWFRLALPNVMNVKTERVLYLDVDITICNSIKKLYYTDFEQKMMVCCRDMATTSWDNLVDLQKKLLVKREGDDFFYFNSGVILFNLPKMRAEGYTFEYFTEIAEQYGKLMYTKDQDLLNFVFDRSQVKLADENVYDFFGYTSYKKRGIAYDYVKENVSIVHWAGFKPWDVESVRYPTERLFWDYAKLTPFYYELLEEVVLGEIDTAYADRNITEAIEKLKVANSEKATFFETIEGYKQILRRLNVIS